MRQEDFMANDIKYYVVKQKALPEVLLKVAEVNRLIEIKGIPIADATEKVGISRSSYYKYKVIYSHSGIMLKERR